MATKTIRTDDEVMKRFDEIAENLGLSSNACINVFMRKFIAYRGFPFSVRDTSTCRANIPAARLSDHGTIIAPKEWRDADDESDEWD